MYKAPGSVLGGTPQYSGYLGPTSDPWKLINQDVAKKLQSRGVSVVPVPGYGAGTPTAGAFNPATNRIAYDPTRAGTAGTLQGEFMHAATANLSPTQLRSFNPVNNFKLSVIRGVNQAAMPGANIGTMLKALPWAAERTSLHNRGGPTTPSPFFRWSEGLAHRSGYGNYWGDTIRDYVVPNPQ